MRALAPKAKSGGKAKPKWAMTADEADDFEDEEAAALVDFASGLDYEGFIDDLEVDSAQLYYTIISILYYLRPRRNKHTAMLCYAIL